MILNYKKSIFIFFICAAIFLLADIGIAHATVTCCTCGISAEVRDPEGGRTTTELRFAGFACSREGGECNNICDEGRTTIPRSGEWGSLGGEERTASGETVTCCRCGALYRCRAVNQTCNTICGELGFEGDIWIRETSEGIEGTGAKTETEETKPEWKEQKPETEVYIPGFSGFSEIKVDGEYINIPWIAEYFVAIFNWLLAMAGGVATVMIMIGGFIWLTAAGNQSRIGQARDMITSAAIGLFLALGSYLILYTINPELVEFQNVRLRLIGREEIGFEELLTTTANTGTVGDSTGTPGEPSPFTSTFSECPISLTNRDSGAVQVSQRSIEFLRTIMSAITGTTAVEKIEQVAEAAVKCGIQLGSCGKATAVISTTAIRGSEAGLRCYDDPLVRNACVSRRTIVEVNATQLSWMRTVACCPESVRRCRESNPPPCCNASSGCTSDETEAKRIVKERLNNELSSEGWPDAWADQLQAGDELVVYNGNPTYGASHSSTFLGWEDTDGRATILQSSWGNPITMSAVCIKSTCDRDRIGRIISRITRPRY